MALSCWRRRVLTLPVPSLEPGEPGGGALLGEVEQKRPLGLVQGPVQRGTGQGDRSQD